MVKQHEYSIFPLNRGLGVLNDNQAILKGRNGWNITASLIILLNCNVLHWRGLVTTIVDGAHAFLLHICCIILVQCSNLQLQHENISQPVVTAAPMALLSSTFVGVDVPHPQKKQKSNLTAFAEAIVHRRGISALFSHDGTSVHFLPARLSRPILC